MTLTDEKYMEHRKECEEVFLKTKSYYKDIIAGILFIITILGGSIAYAISYSNKVSEQTVKIENIDKRVEVIESKFNGINDKLDRIIVAVKK